VSSEYIISDAEAQKLAELYDDIKEKTETFEQFIEKYKREQIDKILKEEQEKKK
jgi:proteasome assembly chaperone (PAC2) family protein